MLAEAGQAGFVKSQPPTNHGRGVTLRHIIAAAVVFIAAVAAWQGWQYYQVKQAEEAQFVDLIACERDCRSCSYAAALDCENRFRARCRRGR